MKQLFYSIYVRPILPPPPEKEECFATHVPPGGDRERVVASMHAGVFIFWLNGVILADKQFFLTYLE